MDTMPVLGAMMIGLRVGHVVGDILLQTHTQASRKSQPGSSEV